MKRICLNDIAAIWMLCIGHGPRTLSWSVRYSRSVQLWNPPGIASHKGRSCFQQQECPGSRGHEATLYHDGAGPRLSSSRSIKCCGFRSPWTRPQQASVHTASMAASHSCGSERRRVLRLVGKYSIIRMYRRTPRTCKHGLLNLQAWTLEAGYQADS